MKTTYYQKHREQLIQTAKTYYANHRELCLAKNREYKKQHPEKIRERNRRYKQKHKEKLQEKFLSERRRLKAEMFLAYGDVCQCCGEKEPIFLTLDHIKNNGSEHRRKKGNLLAIVRELKKLNWPKNDYQLLCFNCNNGRYLNGGLCPHKTGGLRPSSGDPIAALVDPSVRLKAAPADCCWRKDTEYGSLPTSGRQTVLPR